uniref:Ovule protein n=1 Tax=Haemonchus placei TaxID=6290 RepID=A0A0N4WPQ1_HAEPC
LSFRRAPMSTLKGGWSTSTRTVSRLKNLYIMHLKSPVVIDYLWNASAEFVVRSSSSPHLHHTSLKNPRNHVSWK